MPTDFTPAPDVRAFLASANKAAMRASLEVATVTGNNTGDETTATIKTKLGITTLSGANTGDQTSVTGNAGTVTTIAGRIAAGTNVTITGTGTAADPYAISASGGGGGGGAIVTKSTAANYTVGTTDANELYGGVIYVTAAATITVPAVAVGASFTVITIGAVAVSIDPNAADLIYLDGTALSDGDKITNLSQAGDIATLTYVDGTGWYAATNGWTDGN